MSAAPFMKFYPRDWRGDQALRAVSLAARGLWMECLCIMHEAKPYGHLLLNGEPIEAEVLSRMVGAPVDEVRTNLSELRQAGVLDMTRTGIIFSRRMTRDFARAQKGRNAINSRWRQPTEKQQETARPIRSPGRSPITQKPEARIQKEERGDFDRELFPPPVPPSEQPPDDDPVEQAVAIYNAIASTAGWPKADRVTPQRRQSLRARLRECGGLDGWRQAMERAARSAFLCGDNDRGWRANLDFFLQAKSFTKLMEGAYDGRSAAGTSAGRTSAPNVTAEQWDRFIARHRDDPSQWPFGTLGPPPEEPGCRAPADVLARHGFRRASAA